MIRSIAATLCLLGCLPSLAQNSKPPTPIISPLADYSVEWNKPEYTASNTALHADYMTVTEKNTIYVLNLVRMNPRLFVQTVLLQYPQRTGQDYLLKDSFYYRSLVKTLRDMKPLNSLLPDKECFNSANCHALQSGKTGYVGHDRQNNNCKRIIHFSGECCDYGHSDPLDIILSLLIDEGISTLGHRSICLGHYEKIGVSVQPHQVYNTNAVLDLHF